MTKCCTACKQELPAACFRVDMRLVSKLSSACRLCLNERARRYKSTRAGKEYTRAYMSVWRSEFEDKDRSARLHKKWLKDHPDQAKAHMCNNIAKRRYGTKSIPSKDLIALYVSYARKCGYCGSDATGFDHRAPLFSGGTHTLDNLIPCCTDCNRTKGKLSEAAFRAKCVKIGISLLPASG